MKIRAGQSYPFAWYAVDDDTYDGADDSDTHHMIGYGATRDEAIADLQRLLQEKAECDDEAMNDYNYSGSRHHY